MLKTATQRGDNIPVTEIGSVGGDWQKELPVLTSARVTLRELHQSDCTSLLSMLNTEEVGRLMSPPPSTLEGFERFVSWSIEHQRAGRQACFAVVPAGMDVAVGIIQIRRLDADFLNAEWGFALGSPFWGTGVFSEGARLALNFIFNELGVNRLEARAAVRNGRGNGALRKLGAVPEAILRHSLIRNGEALDQQLWAILARDWRASSSRPRRPSIH